MSGSVAGKVAGTLAIVVLGAAAYLLLWPVPARPVAWQAPVALGYVGPHATNTRLSGLRAIDIGAQAEGAEIHVAYPADHASAKVQALVEHLRRTFGRPAYWETA